MVNTKKVEDQSLPPIISLEYLTQGCQEMDIRAIGQLNQRDLDFHMGLDIDQIQEIKSTRNIKDLTNLRKTILVTMLQATQVLMGTLDLEEKIEKILCTTQRIDLNKTAKENSK